MNRKPLAIGLLVIAVTTTASLVPMWRDRRGVKPVDSLVSVDDGTPSRPFVPAQSAALFVGVRKFKHEGTFEVRFAVDDAIDLAHRFALDPRVRLVPPQRVVLALAGTPEKEESKERLRELREAGATVVHHASQSDILMLLRRQADLAEKDGMLIVSLATHGFVDRGTPFILGDESLASDSSTAVAAPKLFEMAASSRAPRSLFLVDACRERMGSDSRAIGPDPATGAPLLRRMRLVHGQVVFYAAPAGGYAYDDSVSRNGVFTKAVLEGLTCNASATRGVVTIETLRTYVERRVEEWMRAHHKPLLGAATQIAFDGDAKNMPLSSCDVTPPPSVSRVAVNGTTLSAFDAKSLLWQRDTGEPLVRVELADLDGDGEEEVVAASDTSLFVYDRGGHRAWAAQEAGTLRTFAVGEEYRRRTHVIAALWSDGEVSRITLYNAGGERTGTYEHHGLLHALAFGRATKLHAPRLVAAAGNDVFLLDPRKLTRKPLWIGAIVPPSLSVDRLSIDDFDGDRKRDITVTTSNGATFFLDFAGKLLGRSKARDTEFVLVRR